MKTLSITTVKMAGTRGIHGDALPPGCLSLYSNRADTAIDAALGTRTFDMDTADFEKCWSVLAATATSVLATRLYATIPRSQKAAGRLLIDTYRCVDQRRTWSTVRYKHIQPNWDRWHQLRGQEKTRTLSQSEQAELDSLKSLVETRDASRVRLQSEATRSAIEMHQQTIDSLRLLATAITKLAEGSTRD
jgi:hypothetical protein